jgi:hypothetical protein
MKLKTKIISISVISFLIITLNVYSGSPLNPANAITLNLGESYDGASSDYAPNYVNTYSCSTLKEDAAESLFKITLTEPANLTAVVSSPYQNPEVFILGTCDPANCLAGGTGGAFYNNAPAGEYYIVVDDAHSGFEFTLKVYNADTTYDVSVRSNPEGKGIVAGGGAFNNGMHARVSAKSIQYSEYSFSNWTANGQLESIDTALNYEVNGNTDLAANFVTGFDCAGAIQLDYNSAWSGSASGISKFDSYNTVTYYWDGSGWTPTYQYWSEPGPEKLFKIDITEGQNLALYFYNQTTDFDLFMFDGCGMERLFSGSDNAITWSGLSAGTYYLMVDCKSAEGGSFTLAAKPDMNSTYVIQTSASPENGGQANYNGFYPAGYNLSLSAIPAKGYHFSYWIDNSSNTYSDPAYSFSVSTDRSFVAVFERDDADCSEAVTLTTDTVVSGSTSGVSKFDGYSGLNRDESGPEAIYKIELTSDLPHLSLGLSGLNDDLDILILDGCNPDYWLKFGNESISIDNLKAGTYYIIVDGFKGASGNFLLEVSTRNIEYKRVWCSAIAAAFSPSIPVASLGKVEGFGAIYKDSTVVLKAIPEKYKKFLFWADTNAVVVSYDSILTFPAIHDTMLFAVFESQGLDFSKAIPAKIGETYEGKTSGMSYDDDYNGMYMPAPENIYKLTIVNKSSFLAFLSDYQPGMAIIVYDSVDCYPNVCIGGGTSDAQLYMINPGTYYFIVDGGTKDACGDYKITFTENPSEFSWVSVGHYTMNSQINGGTVTGDGIYSPGEVVTITATPAEGMDFVGWEYDGNILSTDLSYSLTVPSFNVSIDAIFSISRINCDGITELPLNQNYNGFTSGSSQKENYGIGWYESGPEKGFKVTLNKAGGRLKATLSNLETELDVYITSGCDGSVCLAYGDSATTYNSPDSDTYYIFVDGYNGASGNFTLNVTQEFPDTITLLVNDPVCGYFTGNGTYYKNEEVNAVAHSLYGSIFNGWIENEATVSSDSLYSFTVNGSRTLTANFTKRPYLNIVETDLTIPAAGGYDTLFIQSNIDWTITNNNEWIDVSDSGGSGDGFVVVSSDGNTASLQRVAEIVVSADGTQPETISIVQDAVWPVTMDICEGTNLWGHSEGTFYQTIYSNNMGDSVLLITINILPVDTTEIIETICANSNYLGFNTSGIHYKTYIAESGCDSIVKLDLTVMPVYTAEENETICEGNDYRGFTESGTFFIALPAVTGCDSIIQLNLTVIPVDTIIFSSSVCEGESFMGYSETGTYFETYTATSGCDSVHQISLIVNKKDTVDISKSICQGESYNGHTVDGSYTDLFTSSKGCDSLVILNLTINTVDTVPVNSTICEGENYEGITVPGLHYLTYNSSKGCDSIVELTLTVLHAYHRTDSVTICEGESYMEHSESGTFSETHQLPDGCDSSIVTVLNVIPLPKITATGNQTICQGDSVSLLATSADSVIWKDNPGNPIKVAPSVTTIYKATAQNICGNKSAEVIVTVNDIPETPHISLVNDSTLTSNRVTGNQWYALTSGLISDADDQTIIPATNGNYFVIVTLDGCRSDSSNILNFIVTDIVDVVSDETVKAYPVPATSDITILSAKPIESFSLTSIDGSILLSVNNINSTRYCCSINNFKPGVYNLNIKLKGSNYSVLKRIIKNKK